MKIYQNGYDLTADFDTIPAQNSGNIEIKFERDAETFDDLYIITPTVGYYNGSVQGAKPLALTNNKFILPPEVFVENGYIAIAISMFKDNVLINTNQITFRVNKAVGSYNILPDNEEIWQEAVINVTQQYINKYVTAPVDALLKEAKSQQSTAKTQQDKATQLQSQATTALNELQSLESTVNANEAIRVKSETTRNTSEATRNTKESERQTNESSRQSAESTRKTSEETRVSQESIRQTKESERQTGEANRVKAETERNTKETARNTAESKRQTDTTAAINKLNTTEKKVSDKLANGDFIPNFKATAKAGVVPDVQVKGTKENVILDMTIPEFGGIDEYDRTVNERIHNTGGEYYTTAKGEEYDGVAYTAGADLIRIDGKSVQVITNGYQLFDASKLASKTASGVTVTNNGDGSFTIDGISATSTFEQRYIWTVEETNALLKVGTLRLNCETSNPWMTFGLVDQNNLWVKYVTNKGDKLSVDLVESDLNSNYRLAVNIYTQVGGIGAKTIKPMLYQDGDGTFELFTGGQASPTPTNPQEIKSVGDEKKWNMFDSSKVSEGVITNSGTVHNPSSMWGYHSDFIEVLPNTDYYIKNGIAPSIYYSSAIYDKNKVFLRIANLSGSGIQSGTINTGADARYIIINLHADYIDSVMFIKGSTTPSKYIPYTKTPKYHLYLKTKSANLLNVEEMVKLATEQGIGSAFVIKNIFERNTLMINASSSASRSILFQEGKFKENTQYYIHIEMYSYNSSFTSDKYGVIIYLDFTDGTNQNVQVVNTSDFQVKDLVTPNNKTLKNIRFSYNFHSTAYIDIDKSYISEFNEHSIAKEVVTPIVLDEPLRSLPNGVCDTYKNGVITRRVGKIVYDGSDNEAWSQAQTSDDLFRYNIGMNVSTALNNKFLISHLKYMDNWDGVMREPGYFVLADNFLRIVVALNSVESLKTWLKSNPMTVLYELATPTYEKIKLPAIPTYFPATTISQEHEVVTNINYGILSKTAILQREVDEDKSIYSDKFFERFFAMQRTGKVYTVKFPKFETSSLPGGTKLDDNEGLVAIPSTDVVKGESDYDDIPLFKTYDVNAHVTDDGKVTVDAIKGDKDYKDTGKVDVFVLGMSYYEKYWEEDGYWYYSRTDSPKEGYTLAAECKAVDGTERPYALYGKYVAGLIDGMPYSSKGLTPVTHISSNNAAYISHNHAEPLFHKRGQYYCAGALSTYKYIMTSFYLKYATLNSQSVMYGCFNYNLQYAVALAESNVKRVILTTAQANNFIVGSAVSIGDKTTNSSADRAYAYMHNIANNVLITKIEAINGTQSAVYVNVATSFTTTATTYISSMHWHSGFSDKVKGRDGCPGNLTNGKFPMVIQGIELAVGGYEVPGNAIMDIPGNALQRDVYITNDASKITTNVATIKNTYSKSHTANASAINNWNYVTEMKLDVDNGAMLITKAGVSGSGSATGYCDGMYIDSGTTGQREFLLLGYLWVGAICGLSYLNAVSGLSSAYWYILARLSILA